LPDHNDTYLNESSTYILLSLTSRPKHGYAIARAIEAMSGGKVSLSTSTLYTTLARLLDQGLIERLEDSRLPPSPGLPRKVYLLTDSGRRALNAEAERMKTMLAIYQQALQEGA